MADQSAVREAGDFILDIKNLVVHYETQDDVVEAVNGVDLRIARGETYGLVGETGAGKTTIAKAIMGLLPIPPSHIIEGKILLNGENLVGKSNREMRKVRGKQVSMIFQDPMTALNPVHRVGDQIAEVIREHHHISRSEAELRATEMLKEVGIAAERYKDYPHQFSGGMKQRVVIALALACEPGFIIADEPTTALDVTIQAQVLELMRDLREKHNTSILLITHDLGVVAEICDKCAVIYAGQIVEKGTVEQIFDNPIHPYTQGLFHSLPSLDEDVDRLQPIPGLMINPADLPSCCSFYDRCERCTEICRQGDPVLREVEPGHFVSCFMCGGKENQP